MDIGLAIKYAKKGHKIARKGWNDTGMYIVLMSELYLPPYNSIGTTRKLNSQPYFTMLTAQKQWQPGWLASQADLLSDDWEVVE
jgi:hypothetical protein